MQAPGRFVPGSLTWSDLAPLKTFSCTQIRLCLWVIGTLKILEELCVVELSLPSHAWYRYTMVRAYRNLYLTTE